MFFLSKPNSFPRPPKCNNHVFTTSIVGGCLLAPRNSQGCVFLSYLKKSIEIKSQHSCYHPLGKWSDLTAEMSKTNSHICKLKTLSSATSCTGAHVVYPSAARGASCFPRTAQERNAAPKLNSTPPVHVVRESNGYRQRVPRLLSIEPGRSRGAPIRSMALLPPPAGRASSGLADGSAFARRDDGRGVFLPERLTTYASL